MSSHPPVYGPVTHHYGAPPPPAYGQVTPGQAPSGPATQLAERTLADWGRRAPGFLIDMAPVIVALVPLTVGYLMFVAALVRAPLGTESTLPDLSSVAIWSAVGLLLLLAAVGWTIYNRWVVGGATGRSLGRRAMKVRLLSAQTGEPIGAGNAFARDLVHCLDALSLVGFLWPLWDRSRQTFADMIMETVVLDVRAGRPGSSRPDGSPGR